jgi:DNA-binding transcriptional regulator YdaS (Cro superfamily)
MTPIIPPSVLIQKLGGSTAVARLLGIKPSSVDGWRTKGIPRDKLIRLASIAELRGIARRQDLLPDDWHLIWPELAGESLQNSPNEAA